MNSLLPAFESVFTKYSLLTAFALVGAITWGSYLVADKLTRGRLHGSAIAIFIGLVLAYLGGVFTGGKNGAADWPVLSGVGLMGGAMLRDLAIVATAFGVRMEELRKGGAVGVPLPGVDVRLKTEAGALVTREDEPGEIQVRGPGVFRAYWNRDAATAESFDDGWFRTGDMAVIERGYYRIMGRLSVDIIKSGGYKLSALEIEAALLEHPDIRECAVLGLPDDTWGEAVTAVVVLKPGASLELPTLRDWCKGRLSVYKIPHRLRVVAELPRNAMGKVTKPAVRALFS